MPHHRNLRGRAVRRALALTLLGLAPLAAAHDYRLERDGDDLVLYQGHLYSSHAGDDQVRYDPAIVRDARCIDRAGARRTLARPAAYPARFDGSCAVLWIETSSGYWSQTLTGTVNKPKSEVRGALRSWLSEESIKYLAAWQPAAAAPLGAGLELVPSGNPLALETGAKLRLTATWQGRPRPGVAVAYDGRPRGATDAEGRINIRLRHGGWQRISASFEEPIPDTGADRAVRATVLQFQIAE